MPAIQPASPARLLPLRIVEERTGYQKSKLYNLLKAGGFPQPVRDGRAIRFVESEVDAWVHARIAERDAALRCEQRVLLKADEVCARFGVSRAFLNRDRLSPSPTIPIVRIGPHVRYDEAAVRDALRGAKP